METKDILSSYSNSKEQQMQQMLKRAKILKDSCLNGLSALKTNFTRKHEQGIIKSEFERAFSHIFGEDVDTFTRTFSQNMDRLEQQLTKETILESNCQNAFRVPKTQFEKIFTSVLIKPSSLDDYMLKIIIHAQTIQKRLDDKKLAYSRCIKFQELHALDAISEDKAQERCMVSFRQLHSHLKLLSNNDLKGTQTEYGFKRVFAILFVQDLETFTGTMFLNMDQLEKQLDKEEFQEIGSIAAFKYARQSFNGYTIKSQIYLDDEYVVMTRNYFLQYTQLEILEFHETLIQHMESVKKSIDERAHHKQEYDSWVNERQMHTTEEKVDMSKALDASLVDTESNIRPIYDEEPMAEIQTTAKINVFAIGQQHTEQPEFNNEGEVDQNAEKCHDTCPLPAKLTDNQKTELSYQSLESENIYVIETINIELEHKVAKLLKENETLKRHYKELSDSIKTTRARNIEHTTYLIGKNDDFKAQLQEKGFAIAALKNELRKLTRNSVNTKFAKSSILGKPVLQPHRNQSVVRQPTVFKSERPRISKPRFASQVDVNNDLSKPVTTHYLPKEREYVVVKPHHVIASSESRNSSKNISRFSSNDMVHNHYLEEVKKKIQESSRNSEPSVMSSARSQSTTNGSKPKPRINNQKSRNWPASKTSAGTLNLSAGTSFNPKKEGLRVCSELGIHDHNNEPSSSKLVSKVVPPADKTTTSQQELEFLFSPMLYGGGGIPFQLKSDSLPHAHAQTTKTYYKHQDSRIKKAQELKTKTSANSDIKDNSSETKLRGRLLESFQEDAKYEHVGQDTRSQGGKDDQD
ncbi:hypothetical protein Tco_1262231 [Tanacetum coccineum]